MLNEAHGFYRPVCGLKVKETGAMWNCHRELGHDGPCALTPVKPPFTTRIHNRLTICRTEGHEWCPVQPTLGGDWVRCVNCWALDEYIPNGHMPRHGHAKYGVTGKGPDA